MVLDIIEVSQKQAYIFASNKLKDNIERSEQIAWVTSSGYFKQICKEEYDESKNLVYSGGGHTVLQFKDEESAKRFNKIITKAMLVSYPMMEIFVKILTYNNELSPYENLRQLIQELEIKKTQRLSSFKKGSYGIEAIESNTRQPKRINSPRKASLNSISENSFIPEGYTPVYEISDLGDTFAAIVHIDGNGMGKRVNDFQKAKGSKNFEWDSFAKELKAFSEAVDHDFKEAFRRMNERIGEKITGVLAERLTLKNNAFPIRRIITSGDDICYVCAGYIGIESARIFIEELGKITNKCDNLPYSACAGVAIVHSKYPFFRAYNLAESLCSNAKALGASLSIDDNGACVSAIDWHIEYGELGDSLSDIRDIYVNQENKLLYLRPYIIAAPQNVCDKEPTRQYNNFKKIESIFNNKDIGYARSSIKELRTVLRRKEDDVWYYLKYHKIEQLALECYQGILKEIEYEQIPSGEGLEKKIFIKTADGKPRSILFDAIEIMDEFICLD